MPPTLVRGSVKPFEGAARVNPRHPFSRGMLVSLLFTEGSIRAGSVFNNTPEATWGSAKRQVLSANLGPTIVSTNEGFAMRPLGGGSIDFGPDFLSTEVTICIIGLKVDAPTSQYLFGTATGGGASQCSAHFPWSDGNIYFDFAGTRLTVTGNTFNTRVAERYVLTAGSRGQQIWKNGVIIGSNATALSRTPNPANGFQLWPVFGNDDWRLNYFAIYDHQWSDTTCRHWSMTPYEHLYARAAPALALGAPPVTALTVAVSEAVTVSEFVASFLPLPTIVESITVSESVASLLTQAVLVVQSAESIAVSESIASLTAIRKLVVENILTLDAALLSVVFGGSAFDSVTVTDAVSAALSTPAVAEETITVTESVVLSLSPLRVQVAEDIGVTDFTISDHSLLELYERVFVTDAVFLSVSVLTLHLVETISVTEGHLNPTGTGGMGPAPSPLTTVGDYWVVGV